jgi:hypothetical protein
VLTLSALEIKEINCFVTKICLMGKYHNLLYVALKTAWNWNIKQSQVIAALLRAFIYLLFFLKKIIYLYIFNCRRNF